MTNRRDFLKSCVSGTIIAGASMNAAEMLPLLSAAPNLPKAEYNQLPKWRGFNLLEKFNGQNKRFIEDDFKWIHEFGFNFVRLPMDYRMWCVDGNGRKINMQVLDEIDEAVQFGDKYGIHICMNFHRAPGYTVAKPAEAKSVWTDPEIQEICELHWRTFAKKWKNVSNDLVSFNLFNEPVFDEKLHDQAVAVHRRLIKSIHEESPNRLIICDGYEWGNKPFVDLANEKIAQATRGYAPGEISHYKASWAGGEKYPMPSWPLTSGNGLFCSPTKGGIAEEFRNPATITGPFQEPTNLRMRVGIVSGNTTLQVRADGNKIFEHSFKPGPGEGEWKEVVHRPEWKVYQNVYDRDYEVIIPAGTKQIEIQAISGDWLTFSEIGLRGKNDAAEIMAQMIPKWSEKATDFQYRAGSDGKHGELTGGEIRDRKWLKERLAPWTQMQQNSKTGIVVGEFGAYQFTPHDVTLRWMTDMIANWRELGWGYALWNFRGSFGILDSGRSDVEYEDFRGHKLDRKMLTLLQDV
ncbi:MAG: glycoside hydrolase family 5 protein [Thermoguttaceae bacterium]